CLCYFFFFFQAEDGIRDGHVTGVQTCALPISCRSSGEIPCARILIGFSSRTHRAAGAARPVLPCWFAGLLERASSIRWPSLQIRVAARRTQAAVWFLSPADMLHRRARAGLRLGVPCP